jgi:UDP-2,3-diacylglucosamine hydrolase
VVPKGYYRLFSKIYEVVNKNVKITYLAGNHDFWRGSYFSDEFGIAIIDRNLERQINGKKFFISHGDGLAYKDTGYRILKKILRNKISQKLYSLIHPDIGIWLAKRTSATSRTHTEQKDYSQRDGLKDFAIKKIGAGFDFVIMGHRHKPLKVENNGSYYINLGDWIDDFSYGLFKSEEFKLIKFFDLKRKEVVNEEII